MAEQKVDLGSQSVTDVQMTQLMEDYDLRLSLIS